MSGATLAAAGLAVEKTVQPAPARPTKEGLRLASARGLTLRGYAPANRPLSVLRLSVVTLVHALALTLLLFTATRTTDMPRLTAPIVVSLLPNSEPQPVPPAPPVRRQLPAVMPKVKPVTVVMQRTELPQPSVVLSVPEDTPALPEAMPVTVAAPPAVAELLAKSPPPEPKIKLPSSSANYLNNPPPVYPPQSRRLKEKGTVTLRVLVTPQGKVDRVELRRSSGYDRLDDAALAVVPQWQFIPGTRDGVAEAMWVIVPLTFVLSDGE